MASQLFNGTPVPLSASATVTTSSNGGTLKNGSGSFPVCEAAAIILDVTALATTGFNWGAVTLDVFIDTSVDNGTTWYAAYRFAQVTTSTKQQRLDIRDTGIGVSEVGATVADLKATTAINANTVLTQDIRIRWQLNTGGGAATTTFAVWGIFEPGTKSGA